MAVVSGKNIIKNFTVGDGEVEVLKDVTFDIGEGDFTIIFGPSGSGKSTLLHTILGLEPPSGGEISFLSEKIYENTNEDDRGNFRKQHIGMIYQQPNWVKALSVVENVAFPLMLLGVETEEANRKALEVLKSVGMEEKADYVPTELSSGQQQRIALARALVNDPQVIIADEPTGNLDFESGQAMMQLLYDLNKTEKKTIIMVTHDLDYLKFASRAIQIMDGKIMKTYGAGDQKKLMSELRSKRILGGKLDGEADGKTIESKAKNEEGGGGVDDVKVESEKKGKSEDDKKKENRGENTSKKKGVEKEKKEGLVSEKKSVRSKKQVEGESIFRKEPEKRGTLHHVRRVKRHVGRIARRGKYKGMKEL